VSSIPVPDIPVPPQGLIDAAEEGKLVLFVGAGVSRLCGSPDWEGFSRALLNWLTTKDLINHSVRMQLLELPLKMRLSIALNIADTKEVELSVEDYRDMLMTRSPSEKDKGHELYRDLTRISRYYVTTNYDEWLEFTYPEVTLNEVAADVATPKGQRPLVCTPEDLKISNMEDGQVVHLHGSLTNPGSMILTTNDYLNHYRNDRGVSPQNPVTEFLHNLFQKGGWVVLFIGYGLQEMEILEYVLQKSLAFGEDSSPTCRHYLLRGFYSYEGDLLDHLSSYYEMHCGVRLVPFSLDKSDRMQLASVIRDWAKRIKAKPLPPLEKRIEFEKLLEG